MPLPLINKEARVKGCSDSDAKLILDFLISVSDDIWETGGEIYSDIENLLMDQFTFVPIIDDAQDFKKSRLLKLPNAIYKKLIIYTIIHMNEYSKENIHKILRVFLHMEEASITGYIYISIHGRSIHNILPILIEHTILHEEVLYNDYLNKNKLDRGIAIHNTAIVSLAQALLK
jgi:hypothetical protein